jgi:hypothetical protein
METVLECNDALQLFLPSPPVALFSGLTSKFLQTKSAG